MSRIEAVALAGVALALASLAYFAPPALADTLQNQIDAQNQQISQLEAEIAQYQAEINAAEGNKKTLQAAINSLNLQVSQIKAQVAATTRQINVTTLKIKQLGQNIASTQESINASESALEENIRSLQEAEQAPLIVRLFSATSLAQAWQDADEALQVQGGIQAQVNQLESQKASLADSQVQSEAQQATLTEQKATLTSQQQSLTQTTNSKAQLLRETNAQESQYEQLLAAAQAQLASFSAFAANAGGSGLLGSQTVCDSWGCYYNQRDSSWGNMALNGTKYTMKSDGCLVTSLAMVMTHYGYMDVTPVTIDSNPANFAAYFPAYLLTTINIDGKTVARKTTTIDATLASGNPVIVGIYAYGGTHFVVLTSGSHGNYLMRDPYQPQAIDVPFTKYYKIRNIFGVTKVVIS